jgi:hypothetical protein
MRDARRIHTIVGSISVQRTLVLCFILIAVAVRLVGLDAQSMSMDEIFDLRAAALPVTDIVTSETRFPPLYHTVLHVWLRVFGEDTSGRFLSVACGLGTLAYVVLVANLVAGRRAACYAGLLVAFSPFFVWYSQELRAYGMYVLLAAGAMYHYFQACDKGQMIHRLAFVAFSVLGLYTHYFFFVLMFLFTLFGVLEFKSWPTLRQRLLDLLLIALFSLPTIWLLTWDMQRPWGFARTSEFSLGALGYTFFSFFSGYCLGPSLRELHQASFMTALYDALPWLVCFAITSLLLLCRPFGRAGIDFKWKKRLGILSVVPVLLVGVASRFASFGYNVRHVAWAAVPIFVLAGVGFTWVEKRRWRCAILICVLTCFSVSLWQRSHSVRYRNEDMRALAHRLEADARNKGPVLVISGYMSDALAYYLVSDWELVPLSETEDGREMRQAIQHVRAAGQPYGFFWLVYSRPFHGDPTGRILRQLVGSGTPWATFAGVAAYRIETPKADRK